MKKVATGGSEVSYAYNDKGQLTSIQSPGSSPTYNFVYDKWGNNTEVKVGDQSLVTNTYKSNNGLLTQQEYGNGFKVGHNYDSLDRETSRSYNGTTKFYWTYNADGNLARYSESSGRVLEYLYDDIGRLLQVSGADGSYVKTSYDKLDKSTDLHYKTGSQPRDVYFNYSDKDNLPLNVKFGPSSKYIVENTYDDLTRLKTQTYAIPGTSSKLSASYGYIDWTSTEKRTTGTVRGIDYTYVSGGLSTYDRWYEYDGVGNITSENVWTSDATKPLRESYSYDAKNQLVRHDSATLKATYTYAYDAGGNITSKKIYAYTTGSLDGKTATETVNYTYGNDAWKDELTAYNGERIEYDEIGNPELYRGWGMTWQGRQLVKAEKDKTLTFTYDSEGIRTSKTVGSTTTKYLLNGTQILAQTTNGITTSFFYDQQGNRVAMADSSNHFYYYIYNLQGDVIALADASTGKLAATYTYDAWGKCTVTNASGYTIGTQNPFRYKGYYYDTETSLYYLNSRYYDPDTGRFISPDKYTTTGQGVIGNNMFAYCNNNPIQHKDDKGDICFPAAIVGGFINAGVSIMCSVFDAAESGEQLDFKVVATDALIGFGIGFATNLFEAKAVKTAATLFETGRSFVDTLNRGGTLEEAAVNAGETLIIDTIAGKAGEAVTGGAKKCASTAAAESITSGFITMCLSGLSVVRKKLMKVFFGGARNKAPANSHREVKIHALGA